MHPKRHRRLKHNNHIRHRRKQFICRDDFLRIMPGCALIGGSGIIVPVGEHHLAFGQSRSDDLRHMLAPVIKEQGQLLFRGDALAIFIQLSDFAAILPIGGLTGHNHAQAALAQGLGQQRNLGG
ncbi:MAG: hypothetical protein ACD_74C00300G0001, partial [uncultured bacterium]